MTRNFRQEYDRYQGKPEQIKRRASRNAARALMAKSGKVAKGDGKDVDHKNGSPLQNNKNNLRVVSKTTNRSFPRNSKAGKK